MKIGKRLIKLIILILLVIGLLNVKNAFKLIYPNKYSEYVTSYSNQYNLDPYFVYAVIKAESNFKVDALSNKEALGLMQITPSTGQWIAESMGINNFYKERLLEPELNILMGCWYLDNLRAQFNNDMNLVLAAYNGGSGNVEKWLENKEYSSDGKTLTNIPFKETDEYVKRVNVNYTMYKKLYKD